MASRGLRHLFLPLLLSYFPLHSLLLMLPMLLLPHLVLLPRFPSPLLLVLTLLLLSRSLRLLSRVIMRILFPHRPHRRRLRRLDHLLPPLLSLPRRRAAHAACGGLQARHRHRRPHHRRGKTRRYRRPLLLRHRRLPRDRLHQRHRRRLCAKARRLAHVGSRRRHRVTRRPPLDGMARTQFRSMFDRDDRSSRVASRLLPTSRRRHGLELWLARSSNAANTVKATMRTNCCRAGWSLHSVTRPSGSFPAWHSRVERRPTACGRVNRIAIVRGAFRVVPTSAASAFVPRRSVVRHRCRSTASRWSGVR